MPTQAAVKKVASNKPSTPSAKPATGKSEREMLQGHTVYKTDANNLTIVDKKHPLAETLFFPRNETKYDKESPAVKEFVRQGQMQAVGVFPYMNPNTGKKELVVAFGNQRVLKSRAADVPVQFVIFGDWKPEDALNAALAENEQRMNLTFHDQLVAIKRLVIQRKKAGVKSPYAEIAALFGRSSHQWARDMYAVSQLPGQILKKVPDVISFAAAIQVTKAEPKKEGQSIQEAQLALLEELMQDETNLSQKGGVKVERAASTRAGKVAVEKLSVSDLRAIIANDDLDLSLSDEDVRVLIAGILGDKDIKEVQRAGIEWFKKTERKGKQAKIQAKANKAKLERETSIDDVEFESSDEEEELDLPFEVETDEDEE